MHFSILLTRYSLDIVIFGDELHAVGPGSLVHEGRDVGEAARDYLHHPALSSLPQEPGQGTVDI